MTSSRSEAATDPTAPVDLLFTSGRVLTMDADRPRAEAVAVSGGRIVAVGSSEGLAALAGPRTERINLDGRTLIPGMVDPHMHAAMVQLSDWTDLSPMVRPTADDVYATLRDAAPASTGWVVASQFDPSITTGHPVLDRRVLDQLVPDLPLLVLESNGHIGYANSAAFARAGIDRHTPDPPAARFVRDADGEPTGRLEESAAFGAFAAGIPFLTGEALVDAHVRLFEHAAGLGVTMLHDCGIGSVAGPADLDVLHDALRRDSPVRYRGMLVSSRYDEWAELGLRPGDGDDLLRVDGMKAWADGSNQAGTGFQRAPYLGTDVCGAMNHSAEELAEIVARAHADGWQIGVHANGDAAIDVVLDAYQQALDASPRADHRHRIEHCSVLHSEQIARMAELGVSPSFLIGHLRWWGAAFRDRLLGAERAGRYDPCASALGGGLRISLHSDWNVTPIGPLRCVEDAVTRRMAENDEVLNPVERIGVEDALRAVTLDAAWQCRADDVTGSIEVGKYADLAVLDADPTQVDPSTLASIEVSGTWLAGRGTRDWRP